MAGPALLPIVAGLVLGGADARYVGGPRGHDVRQRPPRSTELPLPRDGDGAVREEFEAARRAGTPAAYDLFLARHPNHELARVARRERAALARRAR